MAQEAYEKSLEFKEWKDFLSNKLNWGICAFFKFNNNYHVLDAFGRHSFYAINERDFLCEPVLDVFSELEEKNACNQFQGEDCLTQEEIIEEVKKRCIHPRIKFLNAAINEVEKMISEGIEYTGGKKSKLFVNGKLDESKL